MILDVGTTTKHSAGGRTARAPWPVVLLIRLFARLWLPTVPEPGAEITIRLYRPNEEEA